MSTATTTKITMAGIDWSGVVCEIEWKQVEDDVDLTAAITAIEGQLPDGYEDSDLDYTLALDEATAALVAEVRAE